METINPTFSYLTNLEVMQILQKIKSTKKKFGMRNLATVTYEALQYLEETPCKTQTRESIINYVKDLSSYRLKSHEVLQMVNDPPTSALHTQLLIDDNKAPLTDEENEKIIQLSYKHFHGSGETKEAPAEPTARQKAKSASAAKAAEPVVVEAPASDAPPEKAPEPEVAEAPASEAPAETTPEPETAEAPVSDAPPEKEPEPETDKAPASTIATPASTIATPAEESQPETETTHSESQAEPTEDTAMETDDKEPES
ncbi:DNA-directed RNA polymerase III subunit RPC9 [Drosophila serrata]|uniref:DNA-directed RNA polymerase III subunit RPC9 n=1 Tax=Drosophila serrata TaxID=7274 RepID=UPI000A1D0429|nr:DNA-directed RNA polymerase III subunit RPC9 [Drosophila serrata]